MARLRSCHFTMVLYPGDPVHVNSLNTLTRNGYKFAAILHDMDKEIDGSFLKEHYHVVVSFTRQKDLQVFADEIDLPDHYIEPCRNVDAALRYLTHPDNPEKFQYDPGLIFGPNKEKAILLSSPDKPTENERVLLIIEMLQEMDYPLTTMKVIKQLCKSGLYSDARRMGTFLLKLIDEINCDKLDF